MAKRVITAWQIGRKSKELKKLLNDCPKLKDKHEDYRRHSRMS